MYMFLAYIKGSVPGSPPEIGGANGLGCLGLVGNALRARGRLPAAERGQLPVDRAVCEMGWLPDAPVLPGGEQAIFPGDLPAAQVVAGGVEVPLLLQLAEREAVAAAQEQVGES